MSILARLEPNAVRASARRVITAAMATDARRAIKDRDSGKALAPLAQKMNEMAQKYYDASRASECAGRLGLAFLFREVRRSTALLPMLGVTVLVTHHQNADAWLKWAIDYGEREAGEREPAALITSGRANSRLLEEQFGNTFELVKEPCCYRATTFRPIEPRRLGEVKLRAAVKRVGQASSARSRASTSGPDTGEDSPRSISASRWAASSSQALSRALSASRLAMTRSSSRARSDVGRLRSSSSSDSTESVMVDTVLVRVTALACHKSVYRGRPRRSACRRRGLTPRFRGASLGSGYYTRCRSARATRCCCRASLRAEGGSKAHRTDCQIRQCDRRKNKAAPDSWQNKCR